MLSWLKSKNDSARVYMCMKELMWDLESASPLRRARILILGQIVRATTFGLEPTMQDIFDRPFDYPRSDLIELYEGIEKIRNQANSQLEHLKKISVSLTGAELPEVVVSRSKDSSRGLEIWMCTLGAGVAPNRRDEVRQIWELLQSSIGAVPEAVESLLKDDELMQQRSMQLTGHTNQTMWDDLSIDQIALACRFVPSIFTKRLEA